MDIEIFKIYILHWGIWVFLCGSTLSRVDIKRKKEGRPEVGFGELVGASAFFAFVTFCIHWGGFS
jgi:uncharacterized membrane protein